MDDVPRSTVIALLAITILVSILGTLAVILNSDIAPPTRDQQASSSTFNSEPSVTNEPDATSGRVSMRIIYPPDDPRYKSEG